MELISTIVDSNEYLPVFFAGIFEAIGRLFGGGDNRAEEEAERQRLRIEREKRIADETQEMNNAAVAAREMYLMQTAKRRRKAKKVVK